MKAERILAALTVLGGLVVVAIPGAAPAWVGVALAAVGLAGGVAAALFDEPAGRVPVEYMDQNGQEINTGTLALRLNELTAQVARVSFAVGLTDQAARREEQD